MIDKKDTGILLILQKDARTSNAEIARRLGIAPSAVLERIRKLEERGVIRGYTARIDPDALDAGLLAFVFVQTELRTERKAGQFLASLPEVQEVHHIAGEDCYLVKVRCSSTQDLGRLLEKEIGASVSVTRTRTTISLGTLKETSAIRIPEAGAAATPRKGRR